MKTKNLLRKLAFPFLMLLLSVGCNVVDEPEFLDEPDQSSIEDGLIDRRGGG